MGSQAATDGRQDPSRSRPGIVAWWPTVVLGVVLALLVLGFPARGVGMCTDGIAEGYCTEQVLSWKGSVSWPTSSSFLWAYLAVMLVVLTGLVAGVATNVRAARRARAS
jgi:hypothetical protein